MGGQPRPKITTSQHGQNASRAIFRPKPLPKPLRNDLLASIATFLAFETVSGPKFCQISLILCHFQIQKSFFFIRPVVVFMVFILLSLCIIRLYFYQFLVILGPPPDTKKGSSGFVFLPFGLSWAPLGRRLAGFWSFFGASRAPLGRFLGALGHLLAGLTRFWGAFWLAGTPWALIWGRLGACRAGFFEVLGDSLELSGSHLGSATRAGAQSENGEAQFGHAWAN